MPYHDFRRVVLTDSFPFYFKALEVIIQTMKIILIIIAAPLFLIALAAYIYVRVKLNPKNDPELDDYYYEFEEQHPAYGKYLKWLKITFTILILSALLLFIAAYI